MATASRTQPRKARPPSSIGPVIAEVNRDVRFTAIYRSGNGIPSHAIVLPVRLEQGRWSLLDASGDPIAQPTSADITATPVTVQANANMTEPAVDVRAPWPDDTRHALVLLLHGQIGGIGDRDFLRLLKTADSAKVVRFEHGRLAVEMPDGSQRDLAAVASPLVARLGNAAQLIRDAAAAYLNGTVRDDAGVLARPVFPAPAPAPAPASRPAPAPASRPALAAAATSAVASSRAPAATAASPPAPSALHFALASCQYPAGIVDGSFRRPGLQERGDADIAPADRSLWRLARRFEQDDTLAFTVLAGDQVYVDATAGLFDARSTLDDLAFAYERVRNSYGMDRLTRFGRGGMVALMDDHEVTDNWEPLPGCHPGTPDEKELKLRPARQAYIERQRNFWWPQSPLAPNAPLFDALHVGGFAFFIADTRSQRDGRWLGNWDRCRIMDAAQHHVLAQWIAAQGGTGRPAFIVSPSMLLPRPLQLRAQPAMALHVDGWCGYPRSLHAVLAQAFDADAQRLVFLSGDEHLACLARITLRCDPDPFNRELVLYSVHTSGLYAPYPFANAVPEDFADDGDEFTFFWPDQHGNARRFSCTVQTYFPRNGDGFALVGVQQDSSGWSLSVAFDGAGGTRTRTHRL